jgi:hypothetical protein
LSSVAPAPVARWKKSSHLSDGRFAVRPWAALATERALVQPSRAHFEGEDVMLVQSYLFFDGRCEEAIEF